MSLLFSTYWFCDCDLFSSEEWSILLVGKFGWKIKVVGIFRTKKWHCGMKLMALQNWLPQPISSKMENSLWWALMMGAAYSTVLTSWSITQWYMSGRPEEKMHKVVKWQGLNQCLAKTRFWSLPMTVGFGCTTCGTCRCLANTKDTSIAAVKSELHLGKSQCLKNIQNVSYLRDFQTLCKWY